MVMAGVRAFGKKSNKKEKRGKKSDMERPGKNEWICCTGNKKHATVKKYVAFSFFFFCQKSKALVFLKLIQQGSLLSCVTQKQ